MGTETVTMPMLIVLSIFIPGLVVSIQYVDVPFAHGAHVRIGSGGSFLV
jgi:hypothetical protein